MDEIEEAVGHPGDRWSALKERVQSENITRFATIQADFLALVWCLDQYRINSQVPRGMGNPVQPADRRLAAIYRSKGNWFAELVALLLENQTQSPLAPRSKVQGFSQLHQIDVAWPARSRPIVDPLICAETKMTGAPGYGSTPPRTATNDWTNRRKELKFAAADLKLYRRQQATRIDHWDHWRKKEPPKTFFLWCARMSPKDNLQMMVDEVRALTDTYLDGAGLFAFREAKQSPSYEPVDLGQRHRVSQLDDVLHSIANEIADLSGPDGSVPAPHLAEMHAVDLSTLAVEEADD